MTTEKDVAMSKAATLTLKRDDGYVMFERVGATPYDDVPPSSYRAVAGPGSHLAVDAWLDEDGQHVWIGHDCIARRDVSIMPWPTWQAPREANGDVLPSFTCDKCGVHTFARLNRKLAS